MPLAALGLQQSRMLLQLLCCVVQRIFYPRDCNAHRRSPPAPLGPCLALMLGGLPRNQGGIFKVVAASSREMLSFSRPVVCRTNAALGRARCKDEPERQQSRLYLQRSKYTLWKAGILKCDTWSSVLAQNLWQQFTANVDSDMFMYTEGLPLQASRGDATGRALIIERAIPRLWFQNFEAKGVVPGSTDHDASWAQPISVAGRAFYLCVLYLVYSSTDSSLATPTTTSHHRRPYSRDPTTKERREGTS